MNDRTYNGWTNYETWIVHLWIDNDPGTQEYWRDVAENLVSEDTFSNPARELADRLQSDIRDTVPDALTQGMLGDLLGAALSSVNWDEIARYKIDDARDEVGDDDE